MGTFRVSFSALTAFSQKLDDSRPISSASPSQSSSASSPSARYIPNFSDEEPQLSARVLTLPISSSARLEGLRRTASHILCGAGYFRKASSWSSPPAIQSAEPGGSHQT